MMDDKCATPTETVSYDILWAGLSAETAGDHVVESEFSTKAAASNTLSLQDDMY